MLDRLPSHDGMTMIIVFRQQVQAHHDHMAAAVEHSEGGGCCTLSAAIDPNDCSQQCIEINQTRANSQACFSLYMIYCTINVYKTHKAMTMHDEQHRRFHSHHASRPQ